MGRIIDESLVILELGLSSSITDEEQAIVSTSLRRAEGAVIRYLKYDPVQRVRTEFYPQGDADQTGRKEALWEANSNQAYERRLSGPLTNELQLKHLPVRESDTNGANGIVLYVDYDGRFGAASGAFAAGSQQTEGTDFWPTYDTQDSSGYGVCRDGILRAIGRWPLEPGSVKVTYLAGYTAAELNGQDTIIDASPIMDAVLEEACERVRRMFILKKNSTLGFTSGPIKSEKLGDYSYTLGSSASTTTASSQGRDTGGLMMSSSKEKLEDFVNRGVLFL